MITLSLLKLIACIALSSLSQTSLGVHSSRIHFSPTEGEKWMRDERTPKRGGYALSWERMKKNQKNKQIYKIGLRSRSRARNPFTPEICQAFFSQLWSYLVLLAAINWTIFFFFFYKNKVQKQVWRSQPTCWRKESRCLLINFLLFRILFTWSCWRSWVSWDHHLMNIHDCLAKLLKMIAVFSSC